MTSPAVPRRFSGWLVPALIGLLALWPLVSHWTAFSQLFYFEDEWDLMDLWAKVGFGPWCTRVFAENFVPLFKFLWGGLIVASGGNYFALILAVWFTHALNAALLVRTALHLGASAATSAVAGVVFGLAAVNFETLAWSVQWSAVLALFFFLAGACAIAGWSAKERAPDARRIGLLALLSLASALCFSRGVLTGCAFALWPLLGSTGQRWPRRLTFAVLTALPGLLVAWWIFRHSTGNHQHVGDALHSMATWGLYHYAQAPLRLLFLSQPPAHAGIIAFAGLKTGLFAAGFFLAPRRLRAALLVLFAFELANALLLALGRYHTGLGAAPSSRYQYGPLLTLLPFIAIILSRAFEFVFRAPRFRLAVGCALIVAAAWFVQRPWNDILAWWTPWRGGETRVVLFGTPPAPEPEHLTRLPWMTNERARFLVQRFHLH